MINRRKFFSFVGGLATAAVVPITLIKAPSLLGEVDNYDPVLISLVRRSKPNLIAHDVS